MTNSDQSAPPATASSSVLVTVEIATLDHHGDPGFVHTRGHFLTDETAARFAVTQAQIVAEQREACAVAATITTAAAEDAEGVCVIGTPGEIADALAAIARFAPGTRGADVCAPAYTTSAQPDPSADTPAPHPNSERHQR